jgi:hypothetical protein
VNLIPRRKDTCNGLWHINPSIHFPYNNTCCRYKIYRKRRWEREEGEGVEIGEFFFDNAIGTTRLESSYYSFLTNGFSFKEKTFSRDQIDKSKLTVHEG